MKTTAQFLTILENRPIFDLRPDFVLNDITREELNTLKQSEYRSFKGIIGRNKKSAFGLFALDENFLIVRPEHMMNLFYDAKRLVQNMSDFAVGVVIFDGNMYYLMSDGTLEITVGPSSNLEL